MRIVVIGAGSIGQRHFRNLLALGHDVVAVLDPDAARREEVQRIAPARCLVTADERSVFEGDADAAVICSPNHCHLDQALAAVRRSWHVFVEKPLSHTLAGCEALVERVRGAGKLLAVG
ncbi:MAG: Gfo/Idh/MocA family oxidoreductase, partial [Candidatus Rokubacteria bacterium]|nr:Gfo/Idh/MocA family oxidoreductase [Candidatus Rokubacteria bacterium]